MSKPKPPSLKELMEAQWTTGTYLGSAFRKARWKILNDRLVCG